MWRAAVLALPLVTALDETATQDRNQPRESSGWRCGNAAGRNNVNQPVINANAGIVFLREGSLNYLRESETDGTNTQTFTGETLQQRLRTDFRSDLFCGDYISGYRNPNADNLGGVCIRDYTVGQQWNSIVEADNEARAAWEAFGTPAGYQRSLEAEHTPGNPDYAALWGSGRSGNSPNNWCAEYMKQMLCHIAFPQWAGLRADLQANTNFQNPAGAQGRGHLVRPVSRSTCTSMMDCCNRLQPRPVSQNPTFVSSLLPNEGSNDLSNSFYCTAWNRGLQLARAGTGVGSGSDDGRAEFTVEWEASSSLTPLGFLAVALAVLAALL